ncbi:MAG: hypothetical protein AB7R89_03495 [Dehalococcoidia bacterium]
MPAPMRLDEAPVVSEQPVSTSHRRRPPRIWFVGGALLVLLTILTGPCAGADEATVPVGPEVEWACFGAPPVCLANDPALPWLSYYRDHRVLLGEVLRWTSVSGRQRCLATTFSIICPNDDPRAAGTIYRFEPIDLGTRLLPRGLVPTPGVAVPPLVATYLDQLRRDRHDPTYWLGQAISEPLCVSIGGQADPGTCEVWFTRAVVRYPNRPDATVADVSRGDLGRQGLP